MRPEDAGRDAPRHLPHSRGVGNILPGLHKPAGSNAQRSNCMVSRSSAPEHPRHVAGLVDADAVLAGDRAAVLDAEVEDHAGQLLGGLLLARDGVVEQHERMQVPVAGVEDVGDPDAVLGRQLADPVEHLRQRGAGTTPSCTM